MSGVVLRRMRWWDLPDVLAVERDLFGADAWTVGMFTSELADCRGRRYRVAVADGGRGRPVGYAGLHVFAGEGYVNTIAVARDHWGGGIGSMLLDDMLAAAGRRGAAFVGLEVAASNARAQRLYASRGFEAVGLRRGYYEATGEDAVVMVRTGVVRAPAGAGS